MKIFALRAPRLFGLCCLLALACVPAAQAQDQANYYHLVWDSTGNLVTTPNPLPPVITLPHGGQLTLDMANTTNDLGYLGFQSFGGGNRHHFARV